MRMQQIHFNPENRIGAEGGVGRTFKIGVNGNADHATKHYYLTATENELRKLFGSNIGHASHYKKHVIQDLGR